MIFVFEILNISIGRIIEFECWKYVVYVVIFSLNFDVFC